MEDTKHLSKWHHTTGSNFSAFMAEHCPARFISPDPSLSIYNIYFQQIILLQNPNSSERIEIQQEWGTQIRISSFPPWFLPFFHHLQKCPPELLKFFLFPPRALKTPITSVSSRSRSTSSSIFLYFAVFFFAISYMGVCQICYLFWFWFDSDSDYICLLVFEKVMVEMKLIGQKVYWVGSVFDINLWYMGFISVMNQFDLHVFEEMFLEGHVCK